MATRRNLRADDLSATIEQDDPLLSPLERTQRAGSRGIPARPAMLSPTGSAGGLVTLPSAGGADMFAGFDVMSLDATARAQPGWAIRLAFPTAPPARESELEEFSFNGLIVELTATNGGQSQILELDAYPGFSFLIAADQISARLLWTVAPETPLTGYTATWSVTRGTCETTATRSFAIGGGVDVEGAVPAFVQTFGLYTSDDVSGGGLELEFRAIADSFRAIHTFSNDELLAVLGGTHARVPPGARSWRTPEIEERLQLSFAYGGAVG